MNPRTDAAFPIFQASRRRSHGLVVGVLLVLGYFTTAAVLIRDYSTAPSSVEQVA